MEDKQSCSIENKTAEYFIKRQHFKNTTKDHKGCQYLFPVCSCCNSLNKIQDLKENNRKSWSAEERLEKVRQKEALASLMENRGLEEIYCQQEIKEGLRGKT